MAGPGRAGPGRTPSSLGGRRRMVWRDRAPKSSAAASGGRHHRAPLPAARAAAARRRGRLLPALPGRRLLRQRRSVRAAPRGAPVRTARRRVVRHRVERHCRVARGSPRRFRPARPVASGGDPVVHLRRDRVRDHLGGLSPALRRYRGRQLADRAPCTGRGARRPTARRGRGARVLDLRHPTAGLDASRLARVVPRARRPARVRLGRGLRIGSTTRVPRRGDRATPRSSPSMRPSPSRSARAA